MHEVTQHAASIEAIPETETIVRPAKRSAWVNGKNKQRVVLLGDDSGSMAGVKARQAHDGCQKLNDALADEINRNGFYTSVICFSDDARIVHPWTASAALVGNIAPLNAVGCTNIHAAFEKAYEMLRDAQTKDDGQQEYTFLRPVVFFYSDGQKTRGDDPRPVADKVKELADVITIAIGADSADELLRELASSPAHFYKVTDTADLRKFLADAGNTVTDSFQRGEDATQVTTQMQNR